jgi:hypothetical protein
MSETTALTETEAAPETSGPDRTFDAIDQSLRESGATGAIEELVRQLDSRGEYRALLDALLLQARHELGLPLIQSEGAAEMAEPARAQYEERYVDAIRLVGGKLLARGDIAGAWPYYRAIGESQPIRDALEAYTPAHDDDRVNSVVEVAFNHGVHPRKGFELILSQYGTCSAITSFEHLPREEPIREACAEMLVRKLHEDLTGNIRGDIAQRGQPLPREGTSIPGLIAGREWLFAEEAYHIDVSHLSSTVRVSPLMTRPEALTLAVELTEYGRHLSPRHRYEGDPPFEDVYLDHGIYLRALLGQDVDGAMTHFLAKIAPVRSSEAEPDEGLGESPDNAMIAQVLVGLLSRLGRLDQAIALAAEHLAGMPQSALFCPGVAQLCQRAGAHDRLARIARQQGDLVNYTAAILQGK